MTELKSSPDLDYGPTEEEIKRPAITVVRLRTSTYQSKNGLCFKKELIYLRSLCKGYDILYDEVANIGAEEAWQMIENINDCPDGLYEVRVGRVSRDWESGIIDDYDLVLVPYTKEKKTKKTKSPPPESASSTDHIAHPQP